MHHSDLSTLEDQKFKIILDYIMNLRTVCLGYMRFSQNKESKLYMVENVFNHKHQGGIDRQSFEFKASLVI